MRSTRPATLVAGAIRRLSTEAKLSDGKKTFQSQRSEYQKQMSLLRKQWKSEFDTQQKIAKELEAEERKRIVLDRAIRLREARKISAERQEAARREREEALKRYQERLAIAQRRRESLHAVEDRQVNAAVHDLIEESSSWITLENMNEKITEELFNTPGASTGYKTVQSHLWKYQTYVNSFHRMFTDSTYFANNTPEMAEAQRVEQKEEGKEVMHRVLLENFLNTLISTGEERAKFRNLIEDFSKFSAENDAWSEVDQMIDTATENPSKDEDGSQDGGVVNTTSRDFRSRGRGGSRGSAGGKRRGA